MISTFKFTTDEEKANILAQNTDKTLLEEQHTDDGNFLIMEDVNQAPKIVVLSEWQALQDKNTKLESQLQNAQMAINTLLGL